MMDSNRHEVHCLRSGPSSFRIKVDLTNYGEKRLFWYLVNLNPVGLSSTLSRIGLRHDTCPDTVGQLRRQIERRFLKSRLHIKPTEIWLDDASIPDDESVTILTSNDTIVLKPADRDANGLTPYRYQIDDRSPAFDEEKVDGENEDNALCQISGSEKRRNKRQKTSEACNRIESVKKKVKKAKKKRVPDNDDIDENLEDEIYRPMPMIFDEVLDPRIVSEEEDEAKDGEENRSKSSNPKKKKKKSKRTKRLNVTEIQLNDSNTLFEPLQQTAWSPEPPEPLKKRKEKRKERTSLRRKRKRALERSQRLLEKIKSSVIEINDGDQTVNVFATSGSSASSTSMHIRFEEDNHDNAISISPLNNVKQRQTEMNNDQSKKPLVNGHEDPSDEFPHSESPINSNGIQTSSRHFNMAQRDVLTNKSIVVSRNSTDHCDKSESGMVQAIPKHVNVTDRDYSRYPLLKGSPRVNDIICYKILELSENYTPEMSGYKVGRVIKYDWERNEALLEYLEPVAINNKRGKFDLMCAMDDDVEEPTIYENETTIDLNSVMEARLITD